MRKLAVPTAKNLTTGETRYIDVDFRVYMSVSSWRPITPERFVALLHEYSTSDAAIDDFGNGLMSFRSANLSYGDTATIHYVPKERNSPVSCPVLMTFKTGDPKKGVVCFASVENGIQAAERGDP